MAGCRLWNVRDFEQTEKVVPFFFTSEIAFRQDIGKLAFGINILDLDLWVQVDSVKQPIKRDPVGTGHMSQWRTSAFHNHLDNCFVVFENVKQGAEVRKLCV